ncbi:uncharacterized protein [Amphiura filiformis]|uniref:uncharacterized protein n=1 Tax=Amphiura filiformis TaxID=82378 RepID=UPI003B21D367
MKTVLALCFLGLCCTFANAAKLGLEEEVEDLLRELKRTLETRQVECVDGDNCESWKPHCNTGDFQYLARQNCPVTCEVSECASAKRALETRQEPKCVDGDNCESWKPHCNTGDFQYLARQNCPVTCEVSECASAKRAHETRQEPNGALKARRSKIFGAKACKESNVDGDNCESWKPHCNTGDFQYLARQNCPVTCEVSECASAKRALETRQEPNCVDGDNCESWKPHCNTGDFQYLARQACPVTCEVSECASAKRALETRQEPKCVDGDNCESWKPHCNTGDFQYLARQNCPVTCEVSECASAKRALETRQDPEKRTNEDDLMKLLMKVREYQQKL